MHEEHHHNDSNFNVHSVHCFLGWVNCLQCRIGIKEKCHSGILRRYKLYTTRLMNMLGRKSFDRPMHSPRINRSPREVGSEQGSTKSFCPPTQCSLCFWRWHLLGIVAWLWKNMKTNKQTFEDKMGNCLFSASHKTCHANDIRISDWLKACHAFLRERRTLLMHSIVYVLCLGYGYVQLQHLAWS